jgi:hypothetical protein
MFYDTDHPNVSLSDWESFLRELPSDLIAEIIDQSKIGLPDWFVPVARGVGVASDTLLLKAGHRHGMRRPRDWRFAGHRHALMSRPCSWRTTCCEVFRLDVGPTTLAARRCCDQGLWTIERWDETPPYNSADQILVHPFGPTPIVTRGYQGAMRLATYCHEHGPPAGLRWTPACTPDHQDAVLARLREDDLRGAA